MVKNEVKGSQKIKSLFTDGFESKEHSLVLFTVGIL